MEKTKNIIIRIMSGIILVVILFFISKAYISDKGGIGVVSSQIKETAQMLVEESLNAAWAWVFGLVLCVHIIRQDRLSDLKWSAKKNGNQNITTDDFEASPQAFTSKIISMTDSAVAPPETPLAENEQCAYTKQFDDLLIESNDGKKVDYFLARSFRGMFIFFITSLLDRKGAVKLLTEQGFYLESSSDSVLSFRKGELYINLCYIWGLRAVEVVRGAKQRTRLYELYGKEMEYTPKKLLGRIRSKLSEISENKPQDS